MTLLYWGIIALYFLFAVGVGVALSGRASRSVSDYFVGGRSLPWWLAGTSMVATTFAADTPLAVTELVASHGVTSVYASLFGVGQLLFGATLTGATLTGVGLLLVALACFVWIGRNLRPSRESLEPIPGLVS